MFEKIIRAWKDEAYRASLSETERAALPANPAGPVELREEQLAGVLGGVAGWAVPTARATCPGPIPSWSCEHRP